MKDEFELSRNNPVLSVGEAIYWKGKPKKSAFIAAKSLTLLPIAVIWLILDLNVLIPALSGGEMLMFLIPFFLLHLMPVWLWLGSTLSAGRRWKNTNYYVTNRRIIIQSGFFAVNESSLFYKDIRNAQMRIGLLDRLCHTGNVVFDNGMTVYRNKQQKSPCMENLEDPKGVYDRIQKIILDIQTDMEYPNAYRPAENPGYHTDYRP